MHLESQKKWLRLKFLTQLVVIFILTATWFIQYLDGIPTLILGN